MRAYAHDELMTCLSRIAIPDLTRQARPQAESGMERLKYCNAYDVPVIPKFALAPPHFMDVTIAGTIDHMLSALGIEHIP
jgi:hypothetical protein